jgi:hypothetical protein
MVGEYDPEADRPYTGDTLNWGASLTYRKAGRAGLVLYDAHGFGGVDDSWREQDREDEGQYWATLNSDSQ